MNPRLFAGAAILVAGLLLKLGAPALPVALGVVFAACLQWRMRGAIVPK